MHLLKSLRQKQRISERKMASTSGLARETLRAIERDMRSGKVAHLEVVARVLGYELFLGLAPETEVLGELSTYGVSISVIKDGFNSWKIHYMNFVDEFRRTKDLRLVLIPPPKDLDPNLKALISSITSSLCGELGIETPAWARKSYFLEKPWFVSGVESLKATAILESPQAFRRNNIFVLGNILDRA